MQLLHDQVVGADRGLRFCELLIALLDPLLEVSDLFRVRDDAIASGRQLPFEIVVFGAQTLRFVLNAIECVGRIPYRSLRRLDSGLRLLLDLDELCGRDLGFEDLCSFGLTHTLSVHFDGLVLLFECGFQLHQFPLGLLHQAA